MCEIAHHLAHHLCVICQSGGIVLAMVIIIARRHVKPHAPLSTPYYYLLFGSFLIPFSRIYLGCLRLSLEIPMVLLPRMPARLPLTSSTISAD